MFLQRHKRDHQITSPEEWGNWLQETLSWDHLCLKCVKTLRSYCIPIIPPNCKFLSMLPPFPSPSTSLAHSNKPINTTKKANTQMQSALHTTSKSAVGGMERCCRNCTWKIRGHVLRVLWLGSVQWALVAFILGRTFMLTFLMGLTISQDSEIIQKLCYFKDLKTCREESRKERSDPHPKVLLFSIDELPAVHVAAGGWLSSLGRDSFLPRLYTWHKRNLQGVPQQCHCHCCLYMPRRLY